MKKRKSRDPLAIETARDLENVESVKAWLAKYRAESAAKYTADVERAQAWLAKYRAGAAATDALIVDTFKEIESAVEQIGQMVPEMVEKSWEIQQALKTIRARQTRADAQPLREQRKRWAAAIKREHAALAAELRRRGEPKPSEQAWEELAKRTGAASGYALRRRVGRNLQLEQKRPGGSR